MKSSLQILGILYLVAFTAPGLRAHDIGADFLNCKAIVSRVAKAPAKEAKPIPSLYEEFLKPLTPEDKARIIARLNGGVELKEDQRLITQVLKRESKASVIRMIEAAADLPEAVVNLQMMAVPSELANQKVTADDFIEPEPDLDSYIDSDSDVLDEDLYADDSDGNANLDKDLDDFGESDEDLELDDEKPARGGYFSDVRVSDQELGAILGVPIYRLLGAIELLEQNYFINFEGEPKTFNEVVSTLWTQGLAIHEIQERLEALGSSRRSSTAIERAAQKIVGVSRDFLNSHANSWYHTELGFIRKKGVFNKSTLIKFMQGRPTLTNQDLAWIFQIDPAEFLAALTNLGISRDRPKGEKTFVVTDLLHGSSDSPAAIQLEDLVEHAGDTTIDPDVTAERNRVLDFYIESFLAHGRGPTLSELSDAGIDASFGFRDRIAIEVDLLNYDLYFGTKRNFFDHLEAAVEKVERPGLGGRGKLRSHVRKLRFQHEANEFRKKFFAPQLSEASRDEEAKSKVSEELQKFYKLYGRFPGVVWITKRFGVTRAMLMGTHGLFRTAQDLYDRAVHEAEFRAEERSPQN